MAAKSLTERALDLVYVCYFFVHIPAPVILCTQALYRLFEAWIPPAIASFAKMYIERFQDLLGSRGSSALSVSLLAVEAFCQLSVFIFGTLALLLQDCEQIYALLLIYGASTVTTLISSLTVVFSTPLTTPETIASKMVSVTAEQKTTLLWNYIPCFLVSLIMTIDMASRVHKLVQSGLKAEKAANFSRRTIVIGFYESL